MNTGTKNTLRANAVEKSLALTQEIIYDHFLQGVSGKGSKFVQCSAVFSDIKKISVFDANEDPTFNCYKKAHTEFAKLITWILLSCC
jgi:hypothetical protein